MKPAPGSAHVKPIVVRDHAGAEALLTFALLIFAALFSLAMLFQSLALAGGCP